MSESYFFILCPKYLKVEYLFAKSIKPDTKYKLAIFKGIQKCDQMKQQVKSKIVNGKIDFPSSQLHFNIAFFNPAKNIQFHVKLYQRKPNEQEKQIGSYIILSSDYIKTFKTQEKSHFDISGTLIDGISINFDLFVQKSKSQLNENVKNFLSSNSKNKEKQDQEDDSKSQKSQLSRQFVRKGDGFISPNRRLERKRSPQSRPGSRAKSIQKSDRSFTSPLVPPSKIQQPKKQQLKQKSESTKQQATYQHQPSNSLKFKNTNQIFDIEIENKNSPIKSPKNIQNSKVRTIEAIEQSDTFKIQVKVSPRAQEITKRTVSKSPDSRNIKSPGKFQSQRQSKVSTENLENLAQNFPQIKLSASQNQDPKISILGTQNLYQSKKETRKSDTTLLSSDPHFKMQQSNIRIVMEQSCVNFPVARIIEHTQPTLTLDIEEKNNKSPNLLRALQDSKDEFIKNGLWKRSVRSTELVRSQIHEEQKSQDNFFQQRKTQLLYAIFLLVSAFLIYNVMTPTRRT